MHCTDIHSSRVAQLVTVMLGDMVLGVAKWGSSDLSRVRWFRAVTSWDCLRKGWGC